MRTNSVIPHRQFQEVRERPIALRQERARFQPLDAVVESAEGVDWARGQRFSLDGLVAVQTLDNVALLERKLVTLEQESDHLKEKNIELHNQIVELTVAAEATWFIRTEKISLAFNNFFLKFQELHQPLMDDREKARKLRESESGLSLDDWTKLCQKVGDKALGVAHEKVTALGWYRRGLHKSFVEIEQFHPIFKQSLQTALNTKIQEINRLVNPVAPIPINATSTLVVQDAEVPNPIHNFQSVFELYVQQKTQAIEVLEASNLKIREENSRLEAAKQTIRPEQINAIFLSVLHKQLTSFPTSKFRSGVKLVIQMLEEYPGRLQRLNSNPPVGFEALGLERRLSQLQTGVMLSEKICPVLREIDTLFDEIEKGCPEEAATDPQ